MNGKQLKNSILQWAIQGKLVSQNPKDEPASKLLERIAATRNGDGAAPACHPERSAKGTKSKDLAKKTKKKKPAPASRIYREGSSWFEQVGSAEPKNITEEIPFDIPESWEWCRLDILTSLITKGSSPSWQGVKYVDDGILFITSENVGSGCLLLSSPKYLEPKFNKVQERSVLKKGDILTNIVGASIGRTAIYNLEKLDSNINQAVALIRLVDLSISDYIVFLFNSTFLVEQMIGKTVETARANISLTSVSNLLIPFPPFAEQKRIVNKLEQILPLVDEYDQAQTQLDKLNKELPESLKKSILQQAIQGKLVPQNPKDEPADKLLERINISRHSEHSEESSKKSRKSSSKNPVSRIYRNTDGLWYEQIGSSEPVDISEEIPFEIPETWTWCRLNYVCDIARGGSPRPIQEYLTDAPDGLNWIKIGDTEKGGKYINSTKEKIKPEGLKKTRMIHKGDFLLTNSMSFGRPYISNIDGCIHDGWLVISMLGESFYPDYLYYLLSSQYAYNQFCGKVAGAVVKNLNSDKVAESIIPLPPLAEQKRIVAKLEQLFKAL